METNKFLKILEIIKDKSEQDYEKIVSLLKDIAAKHSIDTNSVEHPPPPPHS